MRGKKIWLSALLALSTLVGSGQDQQYTQFYAASTYLNPAFVGNTIQHRIIGNYRHQWPSIPGAFVSYNASYDIAVPTINSGFGVMFSHDKAGSAGLTYTSINLQYAYEVQLNRNLFFKPGLQWGFNWAGLDYAELIFGDQLVRGGDVSTSEVFSLDRVRYFDFSSGMLLYNESFWWGISAHHINQPNQSILGGESGLPMKYSMHGGYRMPIRIVDAPNRAQAFVAAFNYKGQGRFDQVDVGVYYELDPFVLGVWYRGIPGFKAYQPGYSNNDALAALVGYQVGYWKFGYSYDITISRLITNTGGTHELSIIYEWAGESVPLSKKKRIIPCAKF